MDLMLFFIFSIITSAVLSTFVLFKCSNKSPSKEKEAAAAGKSKSKVLIEKSKTKGTEKTPTKPQQQQTPLQSEALSTNLKTTTVTTSGEKMEKKMMPAKTPGVKTHGPSAEDDGEYDNLTLDEHPNIQMVKTPGGNYVSTTLKAQ